MEPKQLQSEMETVTCPACHKDIFLIGNLADCKIHRVFELTCPLCTEGKIQYKLSKPFRIFFEGELNIDDWDYTKYVKEIR